MDPSTPTPHPHILRHSAATRLVHWVLAVGFMVAMSTGLSLYWRSILGWAMPLFGGKELAVLLHFWCGIGFAVLALPMFLIWRARMRWTPADSEFVRNLREHALHPGRQQPQETGFFNGGQKLFFILVSWSAAILLFTGLVWWFKKDLFQFKKDFFQPFYVVCRMTHRALGVVIAAGFLAHLYKSTLGERGTLRSMITGKVTEEWARSRRPAWHKEVGGGR